MIINILQNKLVKTAGALIIGYLLWVHLASDQLLTITRTIPIFFYPVHKSITGPVQTEITITGRRTLITNPNLSAHIDISTLTEGSHTIYVTKDHLLISPYAQVSLHNSSFTVIIGETHE